MSINILEWLLPLLRRNAIAGLLPHDGVMVAINTCPVGLITPLGGYIWIVAEAPLECGGTTSLQHGVRQHHIFAFTVKTPFTGLTLLNQVQDQVQ